MNLFIAIISIFGFVFAAIVLNKIVKRNLICPICAGVSSTWGWMLAGSALGYSSDSVIIGILMGGSVVGIAYQIDKKLTSVNKSVIFKMLFIPVGFAAVYSVLASWWGIASIALIYLLVVAIIFSISGTSSASAARAAQLEKNMEKCC